MKLIRATLRYALVLFFCGLMTSCYYIVNTVEFSEGKTKRGSSSFAPEVEIDTNTRVPLIIGGPIYSSKPYDLSICYFDETFTYAKVEIRKMSISYDDGKSEYRLSKMKFPLQFDAQYHESYSTRAEGLVTSKSLMLNARFPRLVSRAAPFTLHVKGQLIKKNGTKVPFVINKKYEITRQKGVASLIEVAQAI